MSNSQKKEKKGFLEMNISISGVSFNDKALFAKHLSIMLKSGLTLSESLEVIEGGATGKFKKVLNKMKKSVDSGQSLSESMKLFPKVFSSLFISSTHIGETSGTLTQNLEEIAKQLEKERELFSKIKGAMVYPIVVLMTAFVLGLFLAFIVLPKIIPLFSGLKIDLPLSTRVLIWLANMLESYGIIIITSVVVFVVFILWLVRQKFIKPLTHRLILITPIVKKLSVNINLARFCRTLGTLLRSGSTITESMDVVRSSLNNHYYKKAIESISESVRKGSSLSTELNRYNGLFPVVVSRMIEVGEESGNLDETLYYLANFYEIEVDSTSKKLQTSIEPVLLIFIGLIVGFMAISIITPIYDITGNIKK